MSKAFTYVVIGCLLLALAAGCGARKPGVGGVTPIAGPAGTGQQGVVAPDVSQETFTAISLDGALDGYNSIWTGRSKAVDLSREPDGAIRCRVVGSSKAGNQYGGVRFAVPSAKALRLELSFSNSENIVAIYVDAYGEQGQKRLMRWTWRPGPSRPTPADKTTYVFVPGRATGHFAAAEGAASDAASVRQIDVFIAGKPNAEAGFVLHKAEYAAAQ